MNNVPAIPGKNQTEFPLEVTAVEGTPVFIDAQGGDLTSDAGVLLLRETEAHVGIIATLTDCLPDPRHP